MRAGLAADGETLARVTPIVQERIHTLDEAIDMAGFFFKPFRLPPSDDLVGKGMTAASSAEAARRALAVLRVHPGLEHKAVEAALRSLADELGLKAGQLFGVLRMAVTGQTVSPPLIETMAILGPETVAERIESAAERLEPS